MSEKVPKNDNDSSTDEIIKVETLEMEKDEDMPEIASTLTESQEAYHKIVEIMTPYFDNLDKPQENYGFAKKELLEMKCLFDQLNLMDRIKTKFAFPKFTRLNYPIIKDPDNYTYSKRSISGKTIYFYCVLYSSKKCQRVIKIKIKTNGTIKVIMIIHSNLNTILGLVFQPAPRG